MTAQSNLKFAAALAPKSLSRVFATIVVCLVANGFGTANADIIADRKAGFKRNADSMKAIAAAIGSGDYQTVINRAEGIASWANTIPSYFPEGSDSGDTKARAEIWFEFDAFKAKAKANETAALTLVTAAKSGDQGAMMAGLKIWGRAVNPAIPFSKTRPSKLGFAWINLCMEKPRVLVKTRMAAIG